MTRTRSLFWLTIALALGAAAAQAAGWHLQTLKTDGFSIEFSGDMQVQPTPLKNETQSAVVRSTIYMQDGGSYAFLVGATLLKGGFSFPAGVSGTLESYKCATTDRDESGSMRDGTQTRVVHLHGCANGLKVGASFFMRGQWFYQVVYLIPESSSAADGEHFLASFRLLPA